MVKGLMMKYLMVSCREATLMMAKRDEGQLGLLGQIKLMVHTSMCSVCKKFDKQVREIAHHAAKEDIETGLPAEAKDRLGHFLEQNQ